MKVLVFILKVIIVSAVLFLIDVISKNVVVPKISGINILYPLIPVNFFWLYMLGVLLFVYARRQIKTPSHLTGILIGVFMASILNLPFFLTGESSIFEWLNFIIPSVTIGVVIEYLWRGLNLKRVDKRESH